MDQINKTDTNDISMSFVHEKKINLISQWVALFLDYEIFVMQDLF